MSSVVKEFRAFLRVRKKFWLLPILMMLLIVWGTVVVGPRQCCSTVHLHPFLILSRHANPGHFRFLSRQRREASA